MKKVHRLAENYIAEWDFVEEMKGEWCEWEWSVGYVCYISWWRYWKKYFGLA